MTDPRAPRPWSTAELVEFERQTGRHIPGDTRRPGPPGPLNRIETPEQELSRLARQAPAVRIQRKTRRPKQARLAARQFLIMLVVTLVATALAVTGGLVIGFPSVVAAIAGAVTFVVVFRGLNR